MKKIMPLEMYEQGMAQLYEFVRLEGGNFSRNWTRSLGHRRWVLNDEWRTIVRELPPLIAAGLQYGKPTGAGRWVWSLVNQQACASVFGDEHDRFVATMREFMTIDFVSAYVDAEWRYKAMEEYVVAYRNFTEFAASMAEHGLMEFRLEFTERGMSTKEVAALDAFVEARRAEIDRFRNPPAKKPLFA